MPWYSILPPQLIYLESWVAKVFFALGLITIIPWVVLLAFDLILYISRLSLYELPVVGGRARGARSRGTSGYAGASNKMEDDASKSTSQGQAQGETPGGELDAQRGARAGESGGKPNS